MELSTVPFLLEFWFYSIIEFIDVGLSKLLLLKYVSKLCEILLKDDATVTV